MSTPENGSAADEYRRALIEGAAVEEAHADTLAMLSNILVREGFEDLTAAFREVSRHHRAQVVKHRALAGGINTD